MKNVKQLIVDTIALAVKIPLTLIDVDFDVPLRMPHGSARNSKIKVFPKPWVGSSGAYELAYNRMHTTDVRYFTIKKSNATTTHEVLEEINYKYGYDFELEDIIDRTLPVADQDGNVSFYLQFTEASVGCYGGTVVRTNTEHINTDEPLPIPPANPSDPAPVLSPFPPANTLVKTECHDGELWEYRSDGNGGLTQGMVSANHPSCQVLTLKASKAEDVTSGVTAVNYTFNKETPAEVTLTYEISAGTGEASMIAGVEYKTRDGLFWTTPGFGRSIVIPEGTRSFYVRYTPRAMSSLPEDGQSVNVLLTEKSPGVSITVTDPLSTEITIVPNTMYNSGPTAPEPSIPPPNPTPSPTPSPPPGPAPILIDTISSYGGVHQMIQGATLTTIIAFNTAVTSPIDLTFGSYNGGPMLAYVDTVTLEMYDVYETLIDTTSLNFSNGNTPKVTIPVDVQYLKLVIATIPGSVTTTPAEEVIFANTDITNTKYVSTEDPTFAQKIFQVLCQFKIHRDYSTMNSQVPSAHTLTFANNVTVDGLEYFCFYNALFTRRMQEETTVLARLSLTGVRDSVEYLFTDQYSNPLNAIYGSAQTLLNDQSVVVAITLPVGSCGFHLKVRPKSVHPVPAESYVQLELMTGTNTDLDPKQANIANTDLTWLISDDTGEVPATNINLWQGCIVSGNRYDYRSLIANGAGGVNVNNEFGTADSISCGCHYLNTVGHHGRTWGIGEMTAQMGHIVPISSPLLRWGTADALIPLPMVTDTFGGSAGTMQLQSPNGLGEVRIKPLTQSGVTTYIPGLHKFFFLSKLEEVFGMPSSNSFEADLGVVDGAGALITVPIDRPPIGVYRNGSTGPNVLVEWDYTSDFVRDRGSNRPSHTIDSSTGDVTFTLENSDHLNDKNYLFRIALSNQLGTQTINVTTHSITVPMKNAPEDPNNTATIVIPWAYAFKGVWV